MCYDLRTNVKKKMVGALRTNEQTVRTAITRTQLDSLHIILLRQGRQKDKMEEKEKVLCEKLMGSGWSRQYRP